MNKYVENFRKCVNILLNEKQVSRDKIEKEMTIQNELDTEREKANIKIQREKDKQAFLQNPESLLVPCENVKDDRLYIPIKKKNGNLDVYEYFSMDIQGGFYTDYPDEDDYDKFEDRPVESLLLRCAKVYSNISYEKWFDIIKSENSYKGYDPAIYWQPNYKDMNYLMNVLQTLEDTNSPLLNNVKKDRY